MFREEREMLVFIISHGTVLHADTHNTACSGAV